MDATVGLHGHGQRVVGRARDPPGARDHRRARRPATRPSSATPPPGRAPTRRSSSPRRSSRRRRSTCSSTRRSSTAPGASSARRPRPPADAGPRGATVRPPGRNPLACRPARPAGRRTRTGGARTRRHACAGPRCAHRTAASGGPPWPSVPTTRATSTSPRATAGTATYESYADFDLPTYVGLPTFMKLPWVPDPAELARPPGRTSRSSAPRSTTRSATGPGARFGPRAIREAQYTSRLDPLAPAGRRAVRDPRRRRRRRREHRPGLDRPRPRVHLPQGPRGRRRPARSRSSSAATTRSPGRRPPRSRRSAGRAASASSTSTPTPTPRTRTGACSPGHGTPMRRLIESGAVKGSQLRPGRAARLLAAGRDVRVDAGARACAGT